MEPSFILKQIRVPYPVEDIASQFAIIVRQHPEASAFHHSVGDHRTAGSFGIIPRQISPIHHLQKHLCMGYLIWENPVQSVFEQKDQFSCAWCVFFCQLIGIGQRHQKPAFSPEPHGRALSCHRIGPFRRSGTVVCVHIQPEILIPQQSVGALKLVNDIIPAILTSIREAVGIEGH